MSNALAAIKPQHRVYSLKLWRLFWCRLPRGAFYLGRLDGVFFREHRYRPNTVCVLPVPFFFSWVGQTHGGGGGSD